MDKYLNEYGIDLILFSSGNTESIKDEYIKSYRFTLLRFWKLSWIGLPKSYPLFDVIIKKSDKKFTVRINFLFVFLFKVK